MVAVAMTYYFSSTSFVSFIYYYCINQFYHNFLYWYYCKNYKCKINPTYSKSLHLLFCTHRACSSCWTYCARLFLPTTQLWEIKNTFDFIYCCFYCYISTTGRCNNVIAVNTAWKIGYSVYCAEEHDASERSAAASNGNC